MDTIFLKEFQSTRLNHNEGNRMNRAKAKAWAKLSIEDLGILGEDGLVKWNKELKHFAKCGNIEIYFADKWMNCIDPNFFQNEYYRISLPEIEILGVKVRCNPPETEPLEISDQYYFPDAERDYGINWYIWDGCSTDLNLLKRDMIFKNEEDVIKISKAKGWYE